MEDAQPSGRLSKGQIPKSVARSATDMEDALSVESLADGQILSEKGTFLKRSWSAPFRDGPYKQGTSLKRT